jgi:hypothetical protein
VEDGVIDSKNKGQNHVEIKDLLEGKESVRQQKNCRIEERE